MKRALTTCGRCGREIGFFTDESLKIGDKTKLLHPFCNPNCESKGWGYDNPDGMSVVVGIDGFVMEQHLIRQEIINKAPKLFVDL